MSDTPKWRTMQDVAREAGVSTMTVSRALTAPEKVAAETRERVFRAVAKLGYVPDQAAGALSSRKARLVTALISTLGGSIFAETAAGLARSLREANCQLLLGATDYSQQGEEELISVALGHRPIGVVLTSENHTAGARDKLRGSGVPVVELWELPDDPIDMAVGFSNYDAGWHMTQFVHELGYRKIATMGQRGPSDERGRRRQEGYADAIRELGLGPPRIIHDEGGLAAIEAGAQGLVRLRDQWPDTDAVFCTSDAGALGAISEARRCGLSVPKDIAIAGFGDFDYSGPAGLDLTTLRVPGFRMGEEAGRVLLARQSGEICGPCVVNVGFEAVRRATA
ncbi:LacI family DNA-binding transcriptional regulator [Aurantimonas sp. A2-1-M11]|uniref:LacI family DNA-binding transcriptional regulator n=1 Tax=Aurantimonas sp. A2-1-M11 TaxID=3113712 RepID=UPI002F94A5E8